jgi:two-component system sensor histidine kinase/response regulator
MARPVHGFLRGVYLFVSKFGGERGQRGRLPSGEAISDAIQRRAFDLVLMDLEMPVMGGPEATRKIREGEQGTARHILIVGMTAHVAAHDQTQCQQAGMDGYLDKPVRPEVLRTEIARVVGGNMPKQNTEAAVEHPRQADWDLKELMERLGGDEEFLRELLVIFRQDARMNLEKSRKAMAELDFESLSRAAHTLKGMLRNLSMGAAADKAAALEIASRGKQLDGSEELLGKLVKEMEGILPEVEAQLAGVKL